MYYHSVARVHLLYCGITQGEPFSTCKNVTNVNYQTFQPNSLKKKYNRNIRNDTPGILKIVPSH